MQWWIGQVTDPDKGEWGDSYERKQAEDGEDIYSLRCRVRIVGYHGNDVDLPDKDLPLAHVLLPSNTSTTGGCGKTLQYQGGEVVVGFFFDGEDGQQPGIFGTLFTQPFIRDGLKSSEFDSKKQIDFVPYTPPKVRQRAGKQRFFSESPWPGQMTPGELLKSIATKQKEASTNITIDNPTACEDNEISKITPSSSTIQVNTSDKNNFHFSITFSSGYGSGVLCKNTGMFFNNSLGEIELNPQGFLGDTKGDRLISNMSPLIIESNEGVSTIGSPGADRISSAIAQVLTNYTNGNTWKDSIDMPRFHVNADGGVRAEPGYDNINENTTITEPFDMYFGGVCVTGSNDDIFSYGDKRRGNTSWKC